MRARAVLIILCPLLVVGLAAAEELQLAAGTTCVSDEVSEGIRGAVDPTSYTISDDGQVSANFWFCRELVDAATPSSELGVTFGQLQAGSLVGVVQLIQPWLDYKENSIKPGIYTMRYGIMPADGNHMGVSPYRDYLLLIPATEDKDPKGTLSYVELLSSSGLATGAPHPAVLALFPIWEEIAKPSLTKNEMDQWTIAVKLGDKVLGLVVAGHGEI